MIPISKHKLITHLVIIGGVIQEVFLENAFLCKVLNCHQSPFHEVMENMFLNALCPMHNDAFLEWNFKVGVPNQAFEP
jgi:hypothetical protein